MQPEALGIEDVIQFIHWSRLPFTFLLVASGWLVLRLIGGFLDDLGERMAERRLLIKKLKALIDFLLYFVIALIAITTSLRLGSQVLVALAGAIGLAVGWAFKDLLASVMTGVILLADSPFQVGDRIAFGDYYGEVVDMGLRSVRLVTLDDNLVTIPNSAFLTSPVASANAGALDCMVVIPFYIGAAEDFDLAQKLVLEATATSRYVLVRKPLVVLMKDEFMGERFVTVLRVKAYVFDARFEKAFETDVTQRVKRAFRQHNIRTPDQQYRDVDLNYGRELPRRTSPS